MGRGGTYCGHTSRATTGGQSSPFVDPSTVARGSIMTRVWEVTLKLPVRYVPGPGNRTVPPPAAVTAAAAARIAKVS